MVIKQIRWEKPEQGWSKLNTNGSWNAALGSAAGGGLIRDSWGNWVVGFARKLGSANSFTAEVWALRDGLLLCLQRKLPAVIVEIDTKALVDAFNNPSYKHSVISPIFDDCKHPPVSLIPSIEANCLGVWCNRLCPELSVSCQLNNISSLPKKKNLTSMDTFFVLVQLFTEMLLKGYENELEVK